MIKLLGKTVADKILNRLKNEIFSMDEKPGLAVILVGNDEASQIYVNLKERTAREIGMNFLRFNLSDSVLQEEIIQLIQKLNLDGSVHGIIVQLPLPKGFDVEKIVNSIDPKKDADGFSAQGGSALSGHSKLLPVFPKAIMKLIESSGQSFFGKKAVVIANSELFGETMSEMLGNENIDAHYILRKNMSSNLALI